jgi:hypothetical protein
MDLLRPLVYAETSVFGGAFDAEFRNASREFFRLVLRGKYRLCDSAVIAREIKPARQEIRDYYLSFASFAAEYLELTQAAETLAARYIEEGLIRPRSVDDGYHLALATVSGCDYLVSWNYKHILALERRAKFNAVNVLSGYNPLSIHSPLTLLEPSDED